MPRKENKNKVFSFLLNFLTCCVRSSEKDEERIGQDESRLERNRSHNCAEIRDGPSKAVYSRTRVFPLTHPVTNEMVARHIEENPEPVVFVPRAHRRPEKTTQIRDGPSKTVYSRTRVFPLTHPVTNEMVTRHMEENPEPVVFVPRAHMGPEKTTQSQGGPLNNDFWTVVSHWRRNCKAEKVFNYYAPALDRQDVNGVGAWAWVLSNAR